MEGGCPIFISFLEHSAFDVCYKLLDELPKLSNISAGGNQQFTTRNFSFYNVKTAIDLLWDWGWTWKSLNIVGSEVGIKVAGTDAGGSVIVLDSYMSGTGIGILVNAPTGNSNLVHFSISITNLIVENVPTVFLDGKFPESYPFLFSSTTA